MQHPPSSSTVYLDQPPSCLQFCPSIPSQFIIGTYLLSETPLPDGSIQQSKSGGLQRWSLDPDTNELSLLKRISLPYAVFDLHFHPRDPTLLAIATSTASVALFKVDPTSSDIIHLWTRSVHEDPSVPALFLAWTPSHWPSGDAAKDDGFAVTFSDGRTAVFASTKPLSSADGAVNIKETGAFDATVPIEVWFVALATYDDAGTTTSSSIPYMFTGNDFGSLHTRRLAVEQEDDDNTSLSAVVDYDDRARHHTAGVTSILPLPIPLVDGAPVLLTGSYDEFLRVYHATRRGAVLAEMGLGGGVWRLQLLRTEGGDEGEVSFLVLASCMHGGARVVRVAGADSQWEIEVVAEFTEHESMNYASDVWKPEGGYSLDGTKGSELLCVSSSFYDRRLCTWRVHV
ncbi:hypothetical protein P168DRAFT_308203 [Aspergillus campestris IBT 28561]|uniref:WD40 repeat-like protein n=1 Tax=Aspergillus campestris (strain IBT 28561) TaxID=1392248 RepID=A0A2I1DDY7_ASPC2|nr:uncharacterized protein P168DRAFT_308203 [Aspergillus campestris IBT 28561]PKY08066.1 hypothetical protein P168DRAFT_308203 [Aspergillus campestris IBT 28561]